jgi:hypothetical protein
LPLVMMSKKKEIDSSDICILVFANISKNDSNWCNTASY